MPRRTSPPADGSPLATRLLAYPRGGPLLQWYDSRKRDLPWRRSRDPYAIWVSEVMLQQTQVATVIPYWQRWMERLPTVEALAKADEQDVLSLWQGLGYYRRCRLLLEGARYVAENGMPNGAAEWMRVPGVGRYTAGAIASISRDEPAPVVDGNVERVYARLTADRTEPPALARNAWQWAERELFHARPGDWNQALMELGATICRPVNPDCPSCPLEARCVARQTWTVDEIPAKAKAATTVHLRHIVWVPVCGERMGLRQIPSGQWWQGMWEFPRADACDDMEPPELRRLVAPTGLQLLGRVRHSVTHHRILIDAWLAHCESESDELRWLQPSEISALPMAAPQRRILKLIEGR